MIRLPFPGSRMSRIGSRGRMAGLHDWMVAMVAKYPGRLKALAYANA
jgi:hypothetical protein